MSERQDREYNRGEPYDHEFVQPPSSAADASICSFCGHKQIEHTAPWRVGGSAEPVAPPGPPLQPDDILYAAFVAACREDMKMQEARRQFLHPERVKRIAKAMRAAITGRGE